MYSECRCASILSTILSQKQRSVTTLGTCCLPSKSSSLISLRVFESQDGHPAVSPLIDTQPPLCLQFLLALHCVYYILLPKLYLFSPTGSLARQRRLSMTFRPKTICDSHFSPAGCNSAKVAIFHLRQKGANSNQAKYSLTLLKHRMPSFSSRDFFNALPSFSGHTQQSCVHSAKEEECQSSPPTEPSSATSNRVFFFIVCLSMRASKMNRDTAPVLPLVPPP